LVGEKIAMGADGEEFKGEDLSLPRIILVESTRIRGIHGLSTDFTANPQYFFLAVGTLKFGIQSMDCPRKFNALI
jgi:hypothetical protein